MGNLRQQLEIAFNFLCQINVRDMDVDRMAAAKQILKSVYASLPDEQKEDGDNSG